jgi:hypothetical protein
MVLKLGHYSKKIINIWEVLKCAGEEWRGSLRVIM